MPEDSYGTEIETPEQQQAFDLLKNFMSADDIQIAVKQKNGHKPEKVSGGTWVPVRIWIPGN